MEVRFERQSFSKRLKSMLKVDLRRTFTTPLFYILVGVCFVMPILILVMTTMMDGTTTIDQVTGEPTTIEGFKNVWQIIGSVSGNGTAAGMSLTSMCNINMLYFLVAVWVGLFVSDDFRSGYAKNLFTVRSKKTDYVASKSVVGFIGGACMLLAFFVGALLGGGFSGISFDVGEAGVSGIIMCMLSKICLVGVFAPIYLVVSVAAKQRTWLSVVGSLAVGMLLFSMVPMISPLDSTVLNVALCLAGAASFSVGLGAVGNLILKKTSLV